MPVSARSLFSFSLVAAVQAATHEVSVGKGGLKFDPEVIKAGVGDTITYNFFAKVNPLPLVKLKGYPNLHSRRTTRWSSRASRSPASRSQTASSRALSQPSPQTRPRRPSSRLRSRMTNPYGCTAARPMATIAKRAWFMPLTRKLNSRRLVQHQS